MHCLNPRFWLLSFDFSLGTARIGVGVKINIDYLDVENDFPIKHADCPLTILLPPFSTPRDDATKNDPVTGTIPRCDASHPDGTEQRNYGASTIRIVYTVIS